FATTPGLASNVMEADSAALAVNVCLPFLQEAQNLDGGWGFRQESESRTEATCWALLALAELARDDESEAIARGFQFLRAAQLPDGSWPSTPGEQTGCWVTSLASRVLAADAASPTAVDAWLRRD